MRQLTLSQKLKTERRKTFRMNKEKMIVVEKVPSRWLSV